MLALLATLAFADDSRLSVETDVLVDIFDGVSLQLRRDRTLFDPITVGIGLLRIDIPRYMLDEYNGADPDDWEQVSQVGGRLMLDAYPFRPDEGPSIGVYATLDTFELRRLGDSARMWHVSEGARLGYTWRPFRGGLYLFPALAVFNTHKVAGHNVVAGERFDATGVSPQVMVNVGYTFGRERARCPCASDDD